MKKIFLAALIAFGAASFGFGDCVNECIIKAEGTCLENNCKKLKGHPTKFQPCVNSCIDDSQSDDTLNLCKKKCKN